MPAPEVLLLRHARSVWNEEGRWQGQADPPLSDLGAAQAKRVGDGLKPFDLVVSSDLERARRTAELLARRQPDIVEAGLREFDVGDWSGLTRQEIVHGWPGELADFDAGRLDHPPGGETRAQFEARVLETAGRLAVEIEQRRVGSVLVVSHGGVIRTLSGRPDRPVVQLSGYRAVVMDALMVITEPVELLIRDGTAPFPEAVRSEP